MSLMYEVAALNAAMIQAAEVCRQDMPEGEKVNAVLACFAAMKPVDAEPVVRCKECKKHDWDWHCPFAHLGWVEDDGFCHWGEKRDGGAV